jgi:hypothetical protein
MENVNEPRELETNVFNECNNGISRWSSFLGTMAIPMNIVHNKPFDIVRWYLLLKRGLFSKIKGDIG